MVLDWHGAAGWPSQASAGQTSLADGRRPVRCASCQYGISSGTGSGNFGHSGASAAVLCDKGSFTSCPSGVQTADHMQPAFWAPTLGRLSPCCLCACRMVTLTDDHVLVLMAHLFEPIPELIACIVQEVQPTEDYVLVIDADMVMRKAFDPLALGVGRGWAVSAFFSYMKVGTVQQMLLPLFMQMRASSIQWPVFSSCSRNNMIQGRHHP